MIFVFYCDSINNDDVTIHCTLFSLLISSHIVPDVPLPLPSSFPSYDSTQWTRWVHARTCKVGKRFITFEGLAIRCGGRWRSNPQGLLCWKQVALRGHVVARMEVEKRSSTALCQTDAIMGTRGLTFGFEITNVDFDSAVVCSRLPFIAITTHTSVSACTNQLLT